MKKLLSDNLTLAVMAGALIGLGIDLEIATLTMTGIAIAMVINIRAMFRRNN